MTLTVAAASYDVEIVHRPRQPAPVAIVIPQYAHLDLTRLAVDAIRAFTRRDTYDLWIVDNASPARLREATLALGTAVIFNRTRLWAWWQRAQHVGSLANAVALELAVQVLAQSWAPRWMFAMHSDALPLRAGWLEFLCRRDEPMVGVKASQRNGYPHASGILFDFGWLRALGPNVLLPHLPAWDAAEGPARHGQHWSAWGMTHVPATSDPPSCPVTGWLEGESAEVSWDDTGAQFYAHRGGGTLNGDDNRGWIARARKELGL